MGKLGKFGVMGFNVPYRVTPQSSKITHMVVLGQQIKFRGTLGQCMAKKKELAKIYGVFALKVVQMQ